ncbi:MAG: hypothetical protein V1932_08710 [Chloroflexota bacterium]
MKKWLKKHGRWLVVSLGVLFIGSACYQILKTDTEWKKVFYSAEIALWLAIILMTSGALEKLFKWWDKD